MLFTKKSKDNRNTKGLYARIENMSVGSNNNKITNSKGIEKARNAYLL